MSRRKMTASLPPTPCTPEMRKRVEQISKEQGVSLAEIQRESITLFLSRNDKKSIKKDRLIDERQGVQS